MDQLQPFIHHLHWNATTGKGEVTIGEGGWWAYELVRVGCEWKAKAYLNTKERRSASRGLCSCSPVRTAYSLFPPRHAVGLYTSHKGSNHPFWPVHAFSPLSYFLSLQLCWSLWRGCDSFHCLLTALYSLCPTCCRSYFVFHTSSLYIYFILRGIADGLFYCASNIISDFHYFLVETLKFLILACCDWHNTGKQVDIYLFEALDRN